MTTDRRVLAIWAEAYGSNSEIIMGNSVTNELPWPTEREDLRHFRESTRDHVLVMGRNTYASLPAVLKTARSLSERPILVVSGNHDQRMRLILDRFRRVGTGGPLEGFDIAHDPAHALKVAAYRWPDKSVAVIGGGRLIEAFEPYLTDILMTSIEGVFDGDILAPSDAFFDSFVSDGYIELGDHASANHFSRKAPTLEEQDCA